jgi:protoporphyrinogen oxidase
VAEGYQVVWARAAADLDVRYGQDVRAIERGAVVRVRTPDATFEFDRLVIASPLQDLPRILDATPEERALFGRIRTLDYVCVLVDASGLPPGSVYLPIHFDRAHLGRVMAACRRWPDRDTVQCYLLGDGLDDDALVRAVHEDLAMVGGRVRRVIALARWPYFPHVGPEEFAAGFHDRLEALQGARRTWYTGEILAFSTVDHVAAYSRALVARHFAGAPD